MAAVCLPPKVADKFKQAFVSGDINPEKLMNMSSEERHAFFEKFSDKESATTLNSLFESKLLLKNQKRGMVTWAKTVSGISEPARKDMISKISRLDRVLNPGEQEAFFKDLAATKLGVGVSRDEAKTIAQLSQDVEKARAAMEGGGDRLAFGQASVRLANYVTDLKRSAEAMKPGDYFKHPVRALNAVASNAKAINASMDNSAIFRQGWKTLWTNPRIWAKNAKRSFGDLVRQFGGKEVIDGVNADIISRPNYDRYVKGKLAVGTLEEAFPTTAPEKLPLVGRAYKASEAAYTAFVHRTRADVFDKYLEVAEKSGINVNDPKELEAIGKLVNSLTGRGSLGVLEPVGNTVNNVFFSPRFLKANIDLVTQPFGGGGAKTAFARKQAAANLVKVVSGTAAVLTIANAVKPGSVEWDPRSADFGKIRIGDTRFDVAAGMGSIVTLAARLATMSSKSSTTGQINKLNSGKYGSQTGWDVAHNFIDNKLSPAASVVRDLLKGKDQAGNKTTLVGEAKNLFTPLGVKNYEELNKDPHGANKLLTMIADGLGVAANTYGNTGQSGWKNSDAKEVNAFKRSVGTQKFNQASQEYDKRLNDWTTKTIQKPEYKKMPTGQQKDLFNREKTKIQKDIFKENGFKYKRAKSDPNKYKSLL